jgi:cathepsin L
MKPFVILIAIAVATVCSVSLFDQKLNRQWETFKIENNKNYAHDQEESLRRLIWEKNYKYIEDHNKEADDGVHTYWLAMNRFGDMVLL